MCARSASVSETVKRMRRKGSAVDKKKIPNGKEGGRVRHRAHTPPRRRRCTRVPPWPARFFFLMPLRHRIIQVCTFLGAKQNFTSPNDPTWYAMISG